MRDAEVYQGFERMAAAVSVDNAALNKGFVLMRTRIDALERLLLGGRFAILKLILMQLISPRRVAGIVQAIHADQIERYNLARAKAENQKPKIKPAPIGLIKAV